MIDKLTDRTLQKAMKRKKLAVDSFVVECESTHSYAKKISVAEDTLIVAKEQSGGMGRLDRKFISKEGGCYFTFIKTDDMEKPLTVIPIVSVAIVTILERFGLSPKIKWPNDILVENKKICGFLCNSSNGKIYIGIGLNVFNDIDEIKDIATSLYVVGCKNNKRAEIIAEIVEEFYKLLSQDFAIIIENYKKRLNIYGKLIKVIQRDKEIEGVAHGIDEDGFLILKNQEEIIKVMYGDIIIS